MDISDFDGRMQIYFSGAGFSDYAPFLKSLKKIDSDTVDHLVHNILAGSEKIDAGLFNVDIYAVGEAVRRMDDMKIGYKTIALFIDADASNVVNIQEHLWRQRIKNPAPMMIVGDTLYALSRPNNSTDIGSKDCLRLKSLSVGKDIQQNQDHAEYSSIDLFFSGNLLDTIIKNTHKDDYVFLSLEKRM